MAGRKEKLLIPLYKDLIIVMNGVVEPLLDNIQVRCPLCGNWMISPNGTRTRKDGRVEAFICKNPNCKNEGHKTPKQFILTTSYKFKKQIFNKLEKLYEDLLKDGAKCKTIAKKYKVSPSQISALRAAFVESLDKLKTI